MNYIKIRKVENGYVLSKYDGNMVSFEHNPEYVFESLPKLYKFLKENFNHEI